MTPEEEERMRALEVAVADLRARVDAAGLDVPRAVISPTASPVTRRQVYVDEGASGVADVAKIVLKSSGDTYSAVTIATG